METIEKPQAAEVTPRKKRAKRTAIMIALLWALSLAVRNPFTV